MQGPRTPSGGSAAPTVPGRSGEPISGNDLSWTIDAEELERWFPGEGERQRAVLRGAAVRTSVASLWLGSFLIGAGAFLLPSLDVAWLLSFLVLGSLVPLLLLLLPRRLFRHRSARYSVGETRVEAGPRTARLEQLRCLVRSSRADDDSPNVAWLMGPNLPPLPVIWPCSVPFGEWLAVAALREMDSPEPHPLDPPFGVPDRLANVIYLLTVPSAAAVGWLALLFCYPQAPAGWQILLLVLLGPGLLVLLAPGWAFARCNVALMATMLLFNFVHALAALYLGFAMYIARLAG